MKSLIIALLLVFAAAPLVLGQDQDQEQQEPQSQETQMMEMHSLDAFTPEDFEFPSQHASLGRFERDLLESVRHEFPRLPVMLTSVHSFRLPNYGPLIFISIQPPTIYFTRPLLQQLEEHSRIAEAQAKMVHDQIERASQIIHLRAKEADLVEQISATPAAKKNKKDRADMQKDLDDVRKALASLENPDTSSEQVTMPMPPMDLDLDRMISENYQRMIDRLTVAMRDAIAQTAPRMVDLGKGEKVCINAHIRQNLSGGEDESILFVIAGSDLEAFQKGKLDLEALKQKINITTDVEK